MTEGMPREALDAPEDLPKRGSVKWLGETFLSTEEEVDPDVAVRDDAISVATR